jgi:hypothetical protein
MIDWLAIQFQRVHFGQIVWGKLTFVISIINMILILSVKYDFNPILIALGMGSVSIIGLWITGWWADMSGFKNKFIAANNEETINVIKNGIHSKSK